MSINVTMIVNTTNCINLDTYDLNVRLDLGWLTEWMLWEGGIAFNAAFWTIKLLILLGIFHLVRYKTKWWLFNERLCGSSTPSPIGKKTSWKDWVTLSIDERAIGRDGSTYLWFQYRLIQVMIFKMALGIVLIIMHHYSDKLGEAPRKTLISTTINNFGEAKGVHAVFCCVLLTVLTWLMKHHGKQRQIRSLASHNVHNMNSVVNRHWLLISQLPLTITVDSLFDYLKSRFDAKGLRREGIVLAPDISELLKVTDKLNTVQNIQRHLTKPAPLIRRHPFWKFWNDEVIDGSTYYQLEETALKAEKDAIMKNLEFTGIAFIQFDSPADAKAMKLAIANDQSKWFWRVWAKTEDTTFRPSQWTVKYAPPGYDINWKQLKKPRPLWAKILVWLMLIVAYSFCVILMAAPGFVVRWLQLEGHGRDSASIFWKGFILPNVVSFFTAKITGYVTRLDKYRRHLTLTSMYRASLRSICYIEMILYFFRMLVMKPLPLLLFGQLDFNRDFRWECIFNPVHGSFFACCIIVNTASGILMNHTRSKSFWLYLKNLFTSRSEAERIAYRESYKLEFYFASNYAEIISNFILTSLLIMIFPVIGLVSCVCSVLRFWSDRSALVNIYPASQTSHHDLHKESVNMVLRFAIVSPLALLVYRRIQLGPGKLIDSGIMAPLCLLVLYELYLFYAQWKLGGVWPKWFRVLWFGSKKEDDIEDDEDIVIDSRNNLLNTLNEYQPSAAIQEMDLFKTFV